MEKIIKNCKGVKKCNDGINRMEKDKERKDLKIILGFKENDIYERKEYSILKKIEKVFSNETMIEQVRVKNHFIDLVFPGHVLGTEVDENGHLDRCKIEEKREKKF